MGKKYLIYVDILGYKGKAAEIAEITGIDEDVCRETFLRNPLKKKIDETKTTKFQGISEIEGSDNYIILVDTVEKAIEIVGEITRISIPHKDFRWIPLEVGVGAKEFDEDIPVEPISRKEVITFLKEDIINPYRDHFKQNYKKNVRETFVLFTKDFYTDLEPLDKHYCTLISHKGKSFFLGNLEKIHERCRIYEFLRKIGYPGSRLYRRIDDVYVPPAEYEDIQKALEKKRIVFITGTQEYGKTYTAVRLMWEYFKKGYEPHWIKGGEERERITVRQRLEGIRAELKPNRIVYFEDPFGKTRYEKRDYLEKEIGTIIENVTNVKDSYVIITSREEVFKEFEKDKLSAVDIKEFEEKLNLMRPSYDYEKRKEIVTRWAEEENCAWINNDKLKTIVLEEIKDEKNLTTPLKMWGFAVATVKVNEEDLLRKKIKEKSEETAKAFAEEIRNMTWDKIVFLSFLFVSRIHISFMSDFYKKMVEKLCLVDAADFGEILSWFEDDKVRVGGDRFLDGEYVEFSHPSYSAALKYLIDGNGSFRRKYREIFGRNLLFILAEKDGAVGSIARVVAENFDHLSGDVRNLLFTLAEKDKTAWAVAHAVAKNFVHLPEDVRNLLFKFAEKDKTARDVSQAVAENFDKLPEDVRNRLLSTLAEKYGAADYVSQAVAENFDKLPEDVRNRLLSTLAEKERIAWQVSQVVTRNFDKLPEDVRNRLLSTLAEKDGAADYVSQAVAENFDKLPEDVRNRLLSTLAEKDEAAWQVSQVVAENFDHLPEEVRNLLFILAEKDKTAGNVAWAVAENFDHLPEEVRNLLFILAEKDKTAGNVAWAVAENFDKLPEEVRNLLFKFAEKDASAWRVAWFVTRNFDKLPEDVRNNLLLELATKKKKLRKLPENYEI